jgi:L-ascorbate metabolism protein UlaG (beta-lactamase superfamily)
MWPLSSPSKLGVFSGNFYKKGGFKVKIKWLGHAAFLITSESGIRIITDPYGPADNLKYGRIEESADIVAVSHDHHDHNNVAAVRGNPQVVRVTTEARGIKIKGVATYHDDAGGSQRGSNTIFCFNVDGVNVCHAGDLGHQLSDAQVAELGNIDVLLMPVGGFFTVDAQAASRVCDRLKPKVVIPMHYKNNKCAFTIAGVDEFLKGKSNVTRLDSSEVEFKVGGLPANTQIMVLKPAL